MTLFNFGGSWFLFLINLFILFLFIFTLRLLNLFLFSVFCLVLGMGFILSLFNLFSELNLEKEVLIWIILEKKKWKIDIISSMNKDN